MIHPRPSELDTCRNASPSVGSPEHAPTPHDDGTGRDDRRSMRDDVLFQPRRRNTVATSRRTLS